MPVTLFLRNLLGLAAWALTACDGGWLPQHPRDKERAGPQSMAVAVPALASDAERFQRFALNALFLNLLDNGVPARWRDPSIAVPCEHASVTVNGQPPVAGQEIPALPLVLRWRMLHCVPRNMDLLLSGEVEFAVQQEAEHYRAWVRPVGLRVSSTNADAVLDTPFTSYTPHGLGPATAGHAYRE